MVQLFDLAPTILEWSNIKPNQSFEAISLNPALEEKRFDGRDRIFANKQGMLT